MPDKGLTVEEALAKFDDFVAALKDGAAKRAESQLAMTDRDGVPLELNRLRGRDYIREDALAYRLKEQRELGNFMRYELGSSLDVLFGEDNRGRKPRRRRSKHHGEWGMAFGPGRRPKADILAEEKDKHERAFVVVVRVPELGEVNYRRHAADWEFLLDERRFPVKGSGLDDMFAAVRRLIETGQFPRLRGREDRLAPDFPAYEGPEPELEKSA